MILSQLLLVAFLTNPSASAYSKTCFSMADKLFNHADIYQPDGRTVALQKFCTNADVEAEEKNSNDYAFEANQAVETFKTLVTLDRLLAKFSRDAVDQLRILRANRMICADSKFSDPRCAGVMSRLEETYASVLRLQNLIKEHALWMAPGKADQTRRAVARLDEHLSRAIRIERGLEKRVRK